MKKQTVDWFLFCKRDSEEMHEIPDADSFVRARKKGSLLKLTGKGWLYAGSWKKRFCVLDGTKFYYYENEKSLGSEKSSGVISLDYFDVCEEFLSKEQKNPYVFIIGTSVRGFFDNRHQFAAESSREMQDWIRSVHDVIADARANRGRGGARTRIASDKVSPISATKIAVLTQMLDDYEENELVIEENHSAQLVNTTKDRNRGPQGRRLPQRKSMMPVGASGGNALVKQRSVSLSTPDEQEECSEKRVSSSMEFMASDNPLEEDRQRSNSDTHHKHDLSSTKKPIFGRLGGQHSALTKELETRLKSGLAPGGRRFQPNQTAEGEEESPKKSPIEVEEMDRKVDAANHKLCSLKTEMDGLHSRFLELKRSADLDAQNVREEMQHVLEHAKDALKEIKTKSVECDQVLSEARKARDEHHSLLAECRSFLTQMKSSQLSTLTDHQEET